MLSQLGAYLFVRGFLELRAGVHGIVVCREKGLDISRGRAVLDIGKELELGLHAAGGEDGQGFASGFPSF